MIRQLFISILIGLALCAPKDKVDGKLKSVLTSKGRANVVISFNKDTDPILDRINSMRFDSRTAKITTMKVQLEELQMATQKNAVKILSKRDFKYQALWITNRICIEDATLEVISALAALPEVTEIREEYVVSFPEPVEVNNATIFAEWGIDKIEAQQAWGLPGGNNGAGVYIATIDAGVRGTHEALRGNMRSDYNWFDPTRGTSIPTDESGHGTMVMGTIVGSGGIGVSPGAQWISCRGCIFSCSESILIRCGQWIACPTLPDGQSPDCSKAPQICSNSWGGGQGRTWFDPVINSWHTAGIIPIFAIGNSGPSCESATSPGDAANVIGVGSTTKDDGIFSYSSRGPAKAGHIKPDVSAPGVDVRSAWHTSDTAYNTISGSSMATPHVAGTVALLLSRNPTLTYRQVKNFLQNNIDRSMGSAATCGETPPTTWPNNIYGYGRINARKSLAAVIGL